GSGFRVQGSGFKAGRFGGCEAWKLWPRKASWLLIVDSGWLKGSIAKRLQFFLCRPLPATSPLVPCVAGGLQAAQARRAGLTGIEKDINSLRTLPALWNSASADLLWRIPPGCLERA
ncbi:MAG: hypothetical protein ACYTEW_24030, partial [Planctomycetota bacterium]